MKHIVQKFGIAALAGHGIVLILCALPAALAAQAFSTTTVQGTVYLANGAAGLRNPAVELACVHHRRQPGGCRGSRARDHWRGWICERESRAEPGSDAGGTVLHGRVSHERRHDEHGILGGSGGGAGKLGAGAGAGDAGGAGSAGGEQDLRRPGDRRCWRRDQLTRRRAAT